MTEGIKYKLAALCGVTVEFKGSVFKAEEELVDAVYKYSEGLFGKRGEIYHD